jgi:hypothetical protein
MRYTICMQAGFAKYYKPLLAFTGAVVVALAFYTGFLQGKQVATTQPVTLSCNDNVLDKLSIPVQALANGVVAHASSAPSAEAKGKYMGSKNSTKYYLPTCSAAKRIKPENYIWFASQEDAQMEGYTPGKC